MTREERITAMENQKVLNGRVFDPDTLTKFGKSNLFDVVSIQGGGIPTIVRNVETCLDEEILGIILGVLVEGIQMIEGCKPSSDFTKLATKCGDVKNAGLPKSFSKGNISCLLSSSIRC
ncbi:hypothetical protein H5410_041141 [Solanum commersonii]|uniref:Uncharacterized protein n=1 Tax=Solanum commersonii TaxID=4109 RepID=A0A9J5XQR3_SOLCO|nr:hypothetical protein H5410_041141 [Solanum commersonii]